jgi:hypothetical protein
MTAAMNRYEISRKIAQAIIAISHGQTHLAPSHIGHPGYTGLAFTYDKAVDALVLKAAGHDAHAREVLDYFAQRLMMPEAEVRRNADANGIYGILKLFPSVDDPRAVGFINAFNMHSQSREGEGSLEYWTTPGPLAFMLMAFLQQDPVKYLPAARKLGDMLLVMQRADGAVTDGNRNSLNVNTEPHMDAYAAFLMLHEVTREDKWLQAADKAWDWFVRCAYRPGQAVIFQGVRGDVPGEIFATDVYSWTMAGPAGDRIPLPELERLSLRMLEKSLARVTLELPDGSTRTLTLVDFTDIRDARITADRGGKHPMGSVEWTAGVVLALQKNAVRFWEAGGEADRRKAVEMKALAEYFLAQTLDAYYTLDGVKGLISFYATGQWILTGHGWRTPYFYVKDGQGRTVIKGGSTVGAWPVLPLKRMNPFKRNDRYGGVYDAIPLSSIDSQAASERVGEIVMERQFVETVPREIAGSAEEIPELWRYNQNMFRSFSAGDNYAVILWAGKVLANSEWVKLARDQQRRKAAEIGGLVDYSWGTLVRDAPQAKQKIFRYSILNEVGVAMWGMAVAHYRLGDRETAKTWIRTMVEDIPYHQIYDPNGPGFWNALVSWETNPGMTGLDAEMGVLYREVLASKNLSSALPASFSVK